MRKLISLAGLIALMALTLGYEVHALPMDFGGVSPGLFACDIETELKTNPELQLRQAEFTALCGRDPECWHLKSYRPGMSELHELRQSASVSRGLRCAKFKEPSNLLMKHLTLFAWEFKEAGDLYEVPETALIGVILAENSLNVSLDDKIQDLLASNTGGAVTAGSIGLGQIFPDRARSVERMAAWIENRPLRNNREISESLLTERGSIFYAAAILRDAWKTYARAGIDIRNNVPVLVTLSNLGDVKDRATAARNSHKAPQENYMGSFARWNRSAIDSIRLQPEVCAP